MATIVGFAIGKFVGDAVARAIPEVVGNALSGGCGSAECEAKIKALAGIIGYFLGGAAIGAIVGIGQFAVLRSPGTQSGWWVLASALAWAVGWGIINLVNEPVDAISPLSYIVGVAGAALAGLISGSVLIWLISDGGVDAEASVDR